MTQHSSLSQIIYRLKKIKNAVDNNGFISILKRLKGLQHKAHHTHIPSQNYSLDKTMTEQTKQNNFSLKHEISEFIKSMFSAMFFALAIRTLLLQPFNIPSESMLPNLLVGDYLFVNKFAYGYSKYSFPFAPDLFNGRIFGSDPKRGDVVVFRVVDDGDKDYIKRIIGLPGDRIRFVNGNVILNDKPALIGKIGTFGTDTIDPETIGADIIHEKIDDKTYTTLDVFDTPYDNTGEYIVPEGHYFFSGDNRDNSQDSRFLNGPVGYIPKDRIIGRAEFIFFSIKNSSFLEFWKWPTHIRFNRIFKKIN